MIRRRLVCWLEALAWWRKGKQYGAVQPLKQPLGYTIIEVLIVLAVSGMMFVIAANFIGGKQAKTAFTQGINEMASRIQDTLGQVANGKYSDIPFDCAVPPPPAIGVPPLTITANSNPSNKIQGTNSECVFLGKLLQFNNNSDSTSYETFSMATSRSATSLMSGEQPVRSQDGIVDLTTQQTIPQRLAITSTGVKIIDNAGGSQPPNYSFGFTQSQGTVDAVSGGYNSGAQTVNLVYAPRLTSGRDEGNAINDIIGGQLAIARSATLCLTDGTRYGQIIIGGDPQAAQLSIRVHMNGTVPC